MTNTNLERVRVFSHNFERCNRYPNMYVGAMAISNSHYLNVPFLETAITVGSCGTITGNELTGIVLCRYVQVSRSIGTNNPVLVKSK